MVTSTCDRRVTCRERDDAPGSAPRRELSEPGTSSYALSCSTSPTPPSSALNNHSMPGPRNMKKKAKNQAKKARRSQGSPPLDNEQDASAQTPGAILYAEVFATVNPADRGQDPVDAPYPYDQPLDPPLPQGAYHPRAAEEEPYSGHHTVPASYPGHTAQEDAINDESIPPSLVTEPFIYDPGNGPRVCNVPAFLASTFSAPPTLDDPLCAEFAQEEMLEMLCAVLPEETALVRRVLWACETELMRSAPDTVV